MNDALPHRTRYLLLFALAASGCVASADDTTSEEAIGETASELSSSASAGFAWARVLADGTLYDQAEHSSTWWSTHATRTSTGRYLVTFPALGDRGGNVQVVGYDSNKLCKVVGWSQQWAGPPSGTDIEIDVACHDPVSGAPSDSGFVTFFTKKPASSESPLSALIGAYLWTNSAGTPDPEYQWNATGQAATVHSEATGQYTVHLPGATSSGGSFQVTAYGGDNARRCKVGSWTSDGSSTTVWVRCFSVGGAAADSQFSLLYFAGVMPHGGPGGYVWSGWADPPGCTGTHTFYQGQFADYTHTMTTNIQVCRTGTGAYDVIHPGGGHSPLPGDNYSDTTLATGYGWSDSSYCTVGDWGVVPGTVPYDGRFEVRCWNDAGLATDATFTHAVVNNRP